MRAQGLRPARALRSDAARGRYYAAWLTLSPQHSVLHVPRAAAANETVWIAVLRKLIFGRYGCGAAAGTHCAPVLRAGDIVPARVSTLPSTVSDMSPEDLQQTGSAVSLY